MTDAALAAPSWVVPGTVAQNARFLAGKIARVELCLYEAAASLAYGPADVPPGLATLPLAWHVHLPFDLFARPPREAAAVAVALMAKVAHLPAHLPAGQAAGQTAGQAPGQAPGQATGQAGGQAPGQAAGQAGGQTRGQAPQTAGQAGGQARGQGARLAVLHPPREAATLAAFLDAWEAAGYARADILLENTPPFAPLWRVVRLAQKFGCGLCPDLGHALLEGEAAGRAGAAGARTGVTGGAAGGMAGGANGRQKAGRRRQASAWLRLWATACAAARVLHLNAPAARLAPSSGQGAAQGSGLHLGPSFGLPAGPPAGLPFFPPRRAHRRLRRRPSSCHADLTQLPPAGRLLLRQALRAAPPDACFVLECYTWPQVAASRAVLAALAPSLNLQPSFEAPHDGYHAP